MSAIIKVRREDMRTTKMPCPSPENGGMGYELFANESVVLKMRDTHTPVSTGLRVQIPAGYYAQILPVHEHDPECFPGTLDADYRGIVYVLLRTNTNKDLHIRPRQRIAQLIFRKLAHAFD